MASFGLILCLAGATVASAEIASPTPNVPLPELCTIAPRTFDEVNAIVAAPMASPSPARTPGTVPKGTPADVETIAGISATVREFVACLNAGEPLRVFGLYTDGYLRRQFERQGVLTRATFDALATPEPAAPERRAAILAIRDVRVLANGAVGATVTIRYATVPMPKTFFFTFVRGGDRWLIDDILGELSFSVP